MPLFELDESGSRLVRPMQPAATSFGPESSELVTEHLSELLGEGLLPVAVRSSPDDDQPHMLALDVVGQPVVVEVVAELDSATLIRALGYAGQAGRLTSGDLAELYHGGSEQFGVDLVGFRESLPAAYSRRGLRVGARLLLVCSSVNPEVADALDFLRAPGRQVEVLQMGVIHGAGGRRYLDVSPLAGPIAEMRQVEQANLRLVRSKDAFAAAMAYDEQRRSAARYAAGSEQDTGGRSPFAATGTDGFTTGERSIASVPSGSTPPAGLPVPEALSVVTPASTSARSAGFPATPTTPTTPSGAIAGPSCGGGVGTAQPAAPTPPRTSAFQRPPSSPPGPERDAYTPVFVPAPGGPLIPPDARPLTEDPEDQPHPVPPTAPTAPAPAPEAAAVGSGSGPEAGWGAAAAAPVVPSAAPEPASALSPAPPPLAPSTGAHPLGMHGTTTHRAATGLGSSKQQRAHDSLTALGTARGPIGLVWFRERRGQRLTATLRTDGLIELPSGEVFGDPDAAAQTASHAALTVDGWGVWRIGDGGPTLRQATTQG